MTPSHQQSEPHAMTAAETAPELAPLKRAMHITGQSKTYIYDHLDDKANPFPRPIKLGSRVFWVVSELHDWNRRQIESSPRAGKRPDQEEAP